MLRFIALCGCAAIAAATPSPPFWGPTWTAPFNQTITIYLKKWFNTVQWRYDSTTKPVGSSLYEHSKGQHDEWCTGVVGHETSDEPCNLLASTDGWRRIIYPLTGECCKACNVTDYCGIVAPWWLQQNSTFQGYKTIAGMNCSGWLKVGGEQNFYYAEVSTQQPCQYYEGYPTLPLTSNYWNFIPNEFNRDPIPSSVFAVPAGCDNMCKLTPALKHRLADRGT